MIHKSRNSFNDDFWFNTIFTSDRLLHVFIKEGETRSLGTISLDSGVDDYWWEDDNQILNIFYFMIHILKVTLNECTLFQIEMWVNVSITGLYNLTQQRQEKIKFSKLIFSKSLHFTFILCQFDSSHLKSLKLVLGGKWCFWNSLDVRTSLFSAKTAWRHQVISQNSVLEPVLSNFQPITPVLEVLVLEQRIKWLILRLIKKLKQETRQGSSRDNQNWFGSNHSGLSYSTWERFIQCCSIENQLSLI